jgi:hypothetical protein
VPTNASVCEGREKQNNKLIKTKKKKKKKKMKMK